MFPIGFGHRKRVGKDTATKFLISHMRTNGYRGDIVKGSLAYEPKLQLYSLYKWAGLKHPDYYETEEGAAAKETMLPRLGLSPRQLYIDYCVMLGKICEATLIECLFYNSRNVDVLVLSDMRRPIEADRIKEAGGLTVRIDNPTVPVSHDPVDDALEGYDFDMVIDNSGDLNHLYKQVITIASKI